MTAAAPLEDIAPVFAALGDPTRLGIVVALGERGPQSSVRLATGIPITRQAVSKHLTALEHAGLVRSVRSGRERLWSLQPERLAEAGSALERASERWDAAIERLRSFVESADSGESAESGRSGRRSS
ncbi:metalloregulator ArsR/SmtB family transcription factor [Microbacterium sp.]|uniref:ArsR/SmtB family transcription factor n=1 Tax=Microbacterium sp. TaxID=51671 RepID=UPI002E315E82|nr:metalloregulator ArsR/SmtB family transcription factor [Microbacterium sp.]HEX5731106.1 metalloregulator ArsR/SmtB family transcription factor [Microbacterium sp.]